MTRPLATCNRTCARPPPTTRLMRSAAHAECEDQVPFRPLAGSILGTAWSTQAYLQQVEGEPEGV